MNDLDPAGLSSPSGPLPRGGPTRPRAPSPRLRERDGLPDGLLATETRNLATLLDGPSLLHLPGEREPPLFVSVLLHGNEGVGWEAVRALLADRLRHHGRLRLPRAMSLFLGNLAAAAQGLRHLPGQPDYNRVWPGSALPETPEHALMAQVVETMARRGVFASIDLHNNTGRNPHYGCVNLIDNPSLHLATLFSRTVVYFTSPRGVQSQAMARICPAVTLECGKVGDRHGVEHARDYLDACLHLSALPEHPVPPHDIDLFHTVAQIKVPPDVSFGFGPEDGDIAFAPDLDRLNFRELAAGTVLGRVRTPGARLQVQDERGRDLAARYLAADGGELRLRLPVMPSMLTCDALVIRQDCLGYLMERYDHRVPQRGGGAAAPG
jgi:succinylglutamate desuccinylase